MLGLIFLLPFLGYATAALGPQSLYTSLSSQTFILTSNPGGNNYEIQPYTQITNLGIVNTSLGTFQTYVDVNGQYAYQSYTGGSTVGGCSPRAFQLTIACGSQVALGSVTESPACNYYGTMTTPQACGVSFTVGDETASVSSTSTPTATQTPTNTKTGTVTASSTPMFFVTMFPSASQTATASPSTTPLFMITAWPTTSPVNVSATSTPLFYWTPYPSYDPNNGTSLIALVGGSGSMTATILGAVAVGGLGLTGIIFAVKHFRSGGTVKGLVGKAMANSGKLQAMVKDLPMPDSMKKAIMDPNSMLPPEMRKLVAAAGNPDALLKDLPVPEEMKAKLRAMTSKEELQKRMMSMLEEKKPEDATVPKLPVDDIQLMEDGEAVPSTKRTASKNILIDQSIITKPSSAYLEALEEDKQNSIILVAKSPTNNDNESK
jgi:hypothetical protein